MVHMDFALKKVFLKLRAISSKNDVRVRTWTKLWQRAAATIAAATACVSIVFAGDAKPADAPPLSASPKGGVFASNATVSLSGAKEIRYTLDGSNPVTNSPLYSAPLAVTNSVLLKARAFAADGKCGDLLVETYTLLETNTLDFNSHLPLVIINTFGGAIQATSNILASIRFVNGTTNQHATLVAPCDFGGRIEIKARGYTSLRYPKKSFSFETDDPVSILGFPADTDWILYAPYPDKTLMRDVLAYELSNQLGHYASRTKFVEVFLNDGAHKLNRTNYAGVYVLEEKVKRSDKRVAIHKLSSHDVAEPGITGGYIFKRDHLQEADGEVAEPPARTRPGGLHGQFPTGPGGFPADPAGFLPPEPLFTNALSVVTNTISITNSLGGTNVVLATLAVTVVVTNSAVITNTLAITNFVTVTNMVAVTNPVVVTNAVAASKTVIATNPVVASQSVAGTNSVATTNAVDGQTTVVTTTTSITTSTTYRTNMVVSTNTVAFTNFVVSTNMVASTNRVVATNALVSSIAVVATNCLFTTNRVFVGSPHQDLLMQHLASSGKGFVTRQTNGFFYVEPKATHITAAQRAWLTNHLNRLEEVLSSGDFRNPTNGYASFIDIDSFVDQHLFVEATKNIDGFRFSTFFTKDRGEKIRMEPIWDWNLSFGNARGKHGFVADRWYWPQLDDQQYPWFRRLFEDPDFGQRYVDRWAQWRTNVFSEAHLLARIDELAAFLKEPAARNFERWPVLGTIIGPEHFAGKTYEDDVHYMKSWITNRLAWMNAQFVAPPLPSHPGGIVTNCINLALSAPTGQVYFTIDGSDPRVSGGTRSSVAQAYQAPISVTNTVTVTARTQKENRWSSPVTVKVVLLRIPPPTGG